MAEKNKGNGRKHKATYSHDNKNGGYLVRVAGPQCNMFAGRTVPVTRKDGSENMEDLDKLVWSGNDDGEISGYVGPCSLYSFKPKPKDTKPVEF